MRHLLLLVVVLFAGCSPSPSSFDDGPRNIVWREIVLTALGGPAYRDYPRIAEMTLDDAAAVLGPCMATRPSCGDAVLEHHPGLRDAALTKAWPHYLDQMDPRFVPLLLARGAVADGASIDRAMSRRIDGAPAQAEERLGVIRLLIDAGAPVDVADFYGNTPLHRAARDRDAALVRLLLSHGADPSRRNRDGFEPAMLAHKKGADDVVALLGGAPASAAAPVAATPSDAGAATTGASPAASASTATAAGPSVPAGRFNAPDGEFSIDAPVPLTKATKPVPTPFGEVVLHSYSGVVDGIGFGVSHQTVPAALAADVRSLPWTVMAERGMRGVLAQLDSTLQWERPIRIAGLRAHEMSSLRRDGRTRVLTRSLWAGATLYQVSGILETGATIAQQQRVVELMDSFALPKARLDVALQAQAAPRPPVGRAPPTHRPADDVFVEVALEGHDGDAPATVGMHHPRLYRVHLLHAVPLVDGRIEAPAGDGWRIEPIASLPGAPQQRDGRRYEVIEHRYLLWPQQPGRLVVPGARVDVRTAPVAGEASRRLELRSATLALDVADAGDAAHHWPAQSLQLQRRIAPAGGPGAPVTVELTLEARGIDGDLAGDLAWPGSRGVDVTVVGGLTEREWAVAGDSYRLTLRRRFELYPAASGTLELVQWVQPWHDVDSDSPATARVDAQHFGVVSVGVPGSAPRPASDTADRPAGARGAAPTNAGNPLRWLLAVAAGLVVWFASDLLGARRASAAAVAAPPRLTGAMLVLLGAGHVVGGLQLAAAAPDLGALFHVGAGLGFVATGGGLLAGRRIALLAARLLLVFVWIAAIVEYDGDAFRLFSQVTLPTVIVAWLLASSRIRERLA